MQRLRPTAFQRKYGIFDECSWGLSVAAKLLVVRRHHAERGRTLDAADLRQEIASLNRWRQQAIVNDRAPLVQYGVKVTKYCERLEEIARALKLPVIPALSLSGGSVLGFDEREMRSELGGKPELTAKRIKEVNTHFFTHFCFIPQG